MRTWFQLFLIFVSTTALSAPSTALTGYEKKLKALSAQKGKISEDQRLKKLFELNWNYLMDVYPEWGTFTGYTDGDDRWTDQTMDAILRRERESRATLQVLQTFDVKKLSAVNKSHYSVFKFQADLNVEEQKYPGKFLTMSQLDGIYEWAPKLIVIMGTDTKKQRANILARLKKLPQVLDQDIALLQEGLKLKVTPPKITLRDVPQNIKNAIPEDPWKSPFLGPFKDLPSTISAEEQAQFKVELVDIYKTAIMPAYKKYHDFIATTYIPGCREGIGLSDLPNGKAWYNFKIRSYTTLAKSAEELHQLGLSEVARLRGEIDKIVAETKFKGNYKGFIEDLYTNKKFFFDKPEDLIIGYRDISKRVDPELQRLFGKLPRTPYGVKPVPSHSEKSQTAAYYEPGSQRAGRAGYFFANTYDLKSRPKWEMEALTLHEAVPGHHLQISLADEQENVPEFRKQAGFTAYSEGWGLYAETLGYDLGVYKDPYSRYGQLAAELWRSVRLVVDTGMHALGWSRQRAIDYFAETMGRKTHDLVVEIDRYIVWPGQALAYKVGQLEIKSLREQARADLSERFDIRQFHDVVLGSGAVPLTTLEEQVKAWIASRKTEKDVKDSSKTR